MSSKDKDTLKELRKDFKRHLRALINFSSYECLYEDQITPIFNLLTKTEGFIKRIKGDVESQFFLTAAHALNAYRPYKGKPSQAGDDRRMEAHIAVEKCLSYLNLMF